MPYEYHLAALMKPNSKYGHATYLNLSLLQIVPFKRIGCIPWLSISSTIKLNFKTLTSSSESEVLLD